MPADELPIQLRREGPEPLAVQVADALRGAAGRGALRVGDRLSSTRALAARLGVSRTVTAAAYDQLLAEGWLTGRRGSGTYVTAVPDPPPDPGADPRARPGPAPATRPAPAPPVDLRAGPPCLSVLDPAAWRRAWRAAADRPPLAWPEHAGHPEYRAALGEHLLRHRGLAATPERVLATAGTTAALGEVAATLPAGAVVACEEPGYQRAVQTLRGCGVRVVPAEVDGGGLRPDRLPRGLAAVYCTPAHQFPLGARLSAERRVTLVARARAEGFLVIEDDYDGEMRYDVAPLPLLAALGPDVVVHLGTTSKLLTPTLGVGWLVAPPALHTALLERRRRTSTKPSVAGQLVFTALATHGDLARHLRRLRTELTGRRAAAVRALAARGVAVLGDAAGAHVWLALPDAAAERAVVRGAAGRGVRVAGLADYHQGPARLFGVPVGYAATPPAELARAAAVLADVVTAR